MPIQILSTELANQIAAGEVVERPASVVKELVENSLDAGATIIEVEVERGGHKRLCIKDNGKGIAKDELTLALSRHATSKIFNLDDLENIMSLGFRGEALASISSVSRLTLTSKPLDQDKAWQASTEGRDMQVKVEPAAYPQGTCIDVVDLFFNTPARRKFLRAEKTEFQHIDETLKRIALSRPDVGFILKHNGKIVRKYPKLQSLTNPLKRVEAVCGKEFADNSIYVNSEYSDMTLKGWLSFPGNGRPQNDIQYVYVNGRVMRDKLINHALRQAYEGLIDPNTHPAYVLYFEVNPQQVDVNVHPAKHEVRFHQARLVHDFIFRVSNEALSASLQISENSEPCHVASDKASKVLEQPLPEHQYIRPLQHHDYSSDTQDVSVRSSLNQSVKSQVGANLQSRSGTHYGRSANKDEHLSFSNYQSLMRTNELAKNSSLPMTIFSTAPDKALFGINNLFYYANLVDINVERLRREMGSTPPVKQPLLMPVSLTRDNLTIAKPIIEQLQICGLEIQIAGPRILLKQVPSGTRALNWADILSDILDGLQTQGQKKTAAELYYYALSTAQINRVVDHQNEAEFIFQWLLQQTDGAELVKRVAKKVPMQEWLSQYDD